MGRIRILGWAGGERRGAGGEWRGAGRGRLKSYVNRLGSPRSEIRIVSLALGSQILRAGLESFYERD